MPEGVADVPVAEPGGLETEPGAEQVSAQAAFSFEHGVASGDPRHDRVMLWTRLTPSRVLDDCDTLVVDVIVARDQALSEILVRERVRASIDRDYTVHFDAIGLEANQPYFYRFGDPTRPEVTSEVGRTRTLPAGRSEGLRIAVVACSSYSSGFFNAYADLAARDDIDLVLHLGDYIYEYGEEKYYVAALGRAPEPAHEIVTRADYRARHAQYKRDDALRALHRRHPVISVWDDHEIANNAWREGAHNHQSATEGDYQARKHVAQETYFEWLPVRPVDPRDPLRIYRSFAAGDLCDLIVLDTRTSRDIQDRTAASEPSVTMLGAEQADWVESKLLESRVRGASWRIIVQQVLMLQLKNLTDRNEDSWDGYRASRERLLGLIRDEAIDNVVVLSGDWHSAWAGELAIDPFSADEFDRTPVAVEFHCPSVTSPLPSGLSKFLADSQAVARHDHLRWVDMAHRGYMVLDITHEEVQADWWFTRTTDTPDPTHSRGKGFSVANGSTRLVET